MDSRESLTTPENSPRSAADTLSWQVGRSRRATRFNARALGLTQGWALLRCLLAISWIWLRSRPADPFHSRDGRELRSRARRRHSARRLVRTLGELKGVFAKAGQFAAVRHDLFSNEVHLALASLRDQVPPLGFNEIRGCLEAELGGPIEAHFAEFSPEPLAAASIAQVHRAKLPGGEEVAVKVQYPWLRHSLGADLFWLRRLLAVWRLRARGGLDHKRLFNEFAAGIREELDFEREAQAAQEIAANLAGDKQVVVPEIIASHSSARVLTMSYRPAVRITDRAGLVRLGVAPKAVLEILARAYAKQVFVDGMFHADPHPGNLFVLDEASAGELPRLLFVDFGLSKKLDPELRRELRLGIYALMQRDLDAFIAGMQRIDVIRPGAEATVRRSVQAMFDRLKSVEQPMALAGGEVLGLKNEAKALLQDTPGLQLPNDLLLYAKTMTYVFSLGEELDPKIDLMRLCLPYVFEFLSSKE